MSGRVETLAGDLEAAERATRAAAEHSAEIADNWGTTCWPSIDLGRALCDQGRPVECLRILDESERHPTPPDWEIVVKRPAARALALARLGRLEEAETFAREAVGHADGRQFLDYHADALLVLAEVLRPHEQTRRGGGPRSRKRVALYERKGNVVSACTAHRLCSQSSAEPVRQIAALDSRHAGPPRRLGRSRARAGARARAQPAARSAPCRARQPGHRAAGKLPSRSRRGRRGARRARPRPAHRPGRRRAGGAARGRRRRRAAPRGRRGLRAERGGGADRGLEVVRQGGHGGGRRARGQSARRGPRAVRHQGGRPGGGQGSLRLPYRGGGRGGAAESSELRRPARRRGAARGRGGVRLRAHGRRARPGAAGGAGLQADRRRRHGPEHGRHGRLLSRPSARTPPGSRPSSSPSTGRSWRSWRGEARPSSAACTPG